MVYSTILKNAISKIDLSLTQICNRLESYGLKTNKAHLSKLQNGKLPPAGDRLNEALAIVLGIDPVVLKTAAYKEKIPADVLEKLKETNSA